MLFLDSATFQPTEKHRIERVFRKFSTGSQPFPWQESSHSIKNNFISSLHLYSMCFVNLYARMNLCPPLTSSVSAQTSASMRSGLFVAVRGAKLVISSSRSGNAPTWWTRPFS